MTKVKLDVRPINPKLYDVRALRREIVETMMEEGERQKKLFEQTTAHWRRAKPTFVVDMEDEGDDVVMFVGVEGKSEADDIWGYLNGGTKPHMIFPRRARLLRFKVPYQAGSSPGTLRTGPSRTGDQVVYAGAVKHPGTKARRWTEVVYKRRKKKFEASINRVLASVWE